VKHHQYSVFWKPYFTKISGCDRVKDVSSFVNVKLVGMDTNISRFHGVVLFFIFSSVGVSLSLSFILKFFPVLFSCKFGILVNVFIRRNVNHSEFCLLYLRTVSLFTKILPTKMIQTNQKINLNDKCRLP
jgi:hypothetical protein